MQNENNEARIENEANLPLPCRVCDMIADLHSKVCGDCAILITDAITHLDGIRSINNLLLPLMHDNLPMFKLLGKTSSGFITKIGDSNQQALNMINGLRGLLE